MESSEAGDASKRAKAAVVSPATGKSYPRHIQGLFLQFTASESNRSAGVTQETYRAVEEFRISLEKHCQQVICLCEAQNGRPEFPASSVILEIVGGYKSNLATKASSVDFMLHSPNSTMNVASFHHDIPGKLTSTLHSKGYGARLLTRTRAPIIVGCQKPSQELYQALVTRANEVMAKMRQYGEAISNSQLMTEKPPSDNELLRRLEIGIGEGWFHQERDMAFIGELRNAYEAIHGTKTSDGTRIGGLDSPTGRARLSLARSSLAVLDDVLDRFIDLPDPNLEIPRSGVGIRFTIRFRDGNAVLNTKLFRCYSQVDPHVQGMITFVKTWATNRDINDGSRGTIPSFGYTIMALYYLIHVAKPPVLPNLQVEPFSCRVDRCGLRKGYVEGSALFWIEEEQAVRRAAYEGALSSNKETVGSLLSGFFEYFDSSNSKSREARFNWGLSVISLRSVYGIIAKEAKGWTRVETTYVRPYYPWEKPVETNSRYLLCIEDPFDPSTNVGQCVTYPGMCNLKDEFNRAHRICENIGISPDGDRWNLMEVLKPEPFRGWLYFGRRVKSPIPNENNPVSEGDGDLQLRWTSQSRRPGNYIGEQQYRTIPQHSFVGSLPSDVIVTGQGNAFSARQGRDLAPQVPMPTFNPEIGRPPSPRCGRPDFSNLPPGIKPVVRTSSMVFNSSQRLPNQVPPPSLSNVSGQTVSLSRHDGELLHASSTQRNHGVNALTRVHNEGQPQTESRAEFNIPPGQQNASMTPSQSDSPPQLDEGEMLNPLIEAGLREIESRNIPFTSNNFVDPFAVASTTYADWPTPKQRRPSFAAKSSLLVAPSTPARVPGPFPPPLSSPTSPSPADPLLALHMNPQARPSILKRRSSAGARLSTMQSLQRPGAASLTPLRSVAELIEPDLQFDNKLSPGCLNTPSTTRTVHPSAINPTPTSAQGLHRSSSTMFSPLQARARSSTTLADTGVNDMPIPHLAPDPSLWGLDGLKMDDGQGQSRDAFKFGPSSRRGSKD